jgi:hypothetical protein
VKRIGYEEMGDSTSGVFFLPVSVVSLAVVRGAAAGGS